MPLTFGRPPILVLGAPDLAGQVVAALRGDGHRARLSPDLDLDRPEVRQAQILILADPPEAADLIAALIAAARQHNQPLGRPAQRLILMHPREPAPALPLPADGDYPRLETFAYQDRAVRVLLAKWPLHLGLDPGYGQRPHLLILGWAEPAPAFLLQALRLSHYGRGRPCVTLVCEDSQRVADEFRAAYPQAPLIADLRFAPLTDLSLLLGDTRLSPGSGTANAICTDSARANAGPWPPVTFAFVCPDGKAQEDPAATLSRTPHLGGDQGDASPLAAAFGVPALALAHHLARELERIQGVSPPILVEIGAAVPGGGIENWDGQIIPVSYLSEACRAAVLLDGLGDEIARSIHDYYRDTIAAQGRDPAREAAGQPWEWLPNSYRQANRHQADHFWAKLAVIDCRAVPEELVESFTMSPLEVEQLALIEHQRWAADRYLDGWSYGAVRDNLRKHHPQLIPYEELPEAMKDLDRFAVRGLPTLAARLGLGILRLLIIGVHPPRQTCPDGKPLRRLLASLHDRLTSRYPDRALICAATLIDPRERTALRWLLEHDPDLGLFLLLPRPLGAILTGLPDQAARRDYLSLVARAERRISLEGEEGVATWFSRRAEISLILGDGLPAGVGDKQVRLDAAGGGLAWSFEY